MSKQQFLKFMNNNILGDISVCFIVLGLVIGIVFSNWKINGIDNSMVADRPSYNEYWIQQMLAPITTFVLCFLILLRKVKLRTFILQELAVRCSLPEWITVIE
jgi:hypothetical protein